MAKVGQRFEEVVGRVGTYMAHRRKVARGGQHGGHCLLLLYLEGNTCSLPTKSCYPLRRIFNLRPLQARFPATHHSCNKVFLSVPHRSNLTPAVNRDSSQPNLSIKARIPIPRSFSNTTYILHKSMLHAYRALRGAL